MKTKTNLKLELLTTLGLHAFVSLTLVAALMMACHYQEQNFFSSLQSKNAQPTALATR